uniref:pentapeptide repeat-containing protein n=1 Tax=unclassified Rhodococcus (in: high G+C Gram-positive bacteria) TaxID=192944 RepID=UPI001595C953|nr:MULTISPECIES: pentapeptide repeat-containing protein [unclassified Rhodococcus (in: high G+C Gram-positive bacteria)]
MSSPEPVPTTPDGTTASTNPTTEPAYRRVEAWIGRHKIALSGCFAIGFTGGFAGPSAWDWYLRQDITPGHGTIIGGFFVVTAAAIAYTGTHLTRTSTERIADQKNTLDTVNAERAHNLADIQELRRRFVTTTAQFADPSPEVRLAGVYALEALTNDWIDRNSTTDAQTCINYLCGYLTRPYTSPTHDPHLRQTVVTPDIGTHVQRTYIHPHDDLNVRQAITRTIAGHLQPDVQHSWSTYNYDLTGAHLHDADFSRCIFRGTVNLEMAQFSGATTSFQNAEFYGKDTSFNSAKFHGEWVRFDGAEFHGSWGAFVGAEFHGRETNFAGALFSNDETSFVSTCFSSKRTRFDRAHFKSELTLFLFTKFHGLRTSFDGADFDSFTMTFEGARFDGVMTTFTEAEFREGKETTFHAPAAWGQVYFDWDPRIPYAARPKPDNVAPRDWPPGVAQHD